ncbi:hypothetical protein [Subtercola sp. YIM 133946]|uniref:hypothetical protein n=1 Tax=Subtercola sp. YIM 133946 TaxID=3118909 RepID=UPI002F920721
MGINLSGQVPGEQLNGLPDMEQDLLDARTPESWLAIVVMERSKHSYDDIKQVTSAVVRFQHIEPIEDEDDAKAVRSYLEKAYQRRTGAGSMETTLEIPDDEPVASDDAEAPAEPEPTAPVDITRGKKTKEPMWEPEPEGPGVA